MDEWSNVFRTAWGTSMVFKLEVLFLEPLLMEPTKGALLTLYGFGCFS